MSKYELIDIVINIVGLCSIIIMSISLIISVKNSIQLRKIKAAESIRFYIQSTSDITSSAVAFVSSLSQKQCECLYDGKDLYVDKEDIKIICNICPYKTNSQSCSICKKKRSGILVQKDVSYMIKKNVLLYLNNLECVLLYWELGVVDRKTIEKELLFLKDKDTDYRGLEIMRKQFGGAEAYPAIEKFYKRIEKNN